MRWGRDLHALSKRTKRQFVRAQLTRPGGPCIIRPVYDRRHS